MFEDVYIFKTNDGCYLIADDDLPLMHLMMLATKEVLTNTATNIQYLGKIKGSVHNLVEDGNSCYSSPYSASEACIAQISPDKLRGAIKSLRDSYVIKSEIEYLSRLEKSIA